MPHSPHTNILFWVAKRKEGNKEKKERVSKQKLLKDCHQGQNVTILAILERLELKIFSRRPTCGRQYFSVFHGLSTLKSILPALLVHVIKILSVYENP